MLSLEQKIMLGHLLTPSDFATAREVSKEFVRRYIFRCNKSAYMTSTDIYPVYRKWFRETYPQVQVPPKPRMTEILSTPDKLGKQENRKWHGVCLRRHQPVEIVE